MCGIVLTTSKARAELLLLKLKHRGQDDSRVVRCGCTNRWLGQNRLAIVDRNNKLAQQPYINSNGAVTVFNGEIYNYKEIYQPAQPEIIVIDRLMTEHEEFERILDGYYGIIRVEPEEDRITIARDMFGIIPLYYAVNRKTEKMTDVASEKKALEESDWIGEVRAGQTLSFRMDGTPRSNRQMNFYSMHLEPVDMAHVEFLFRRAVQRRIFHSEVPITISLSGGLDSSLILWVAKDLGVKVEALTVGVNPDSDEAQNAQRLAKEAGVEWCFIQLSDEIIKEHKERILYHLEDEVANPIKWRGVLRNYFIAQYAKGTVILCGEGADEIGAGYPSHARVGEGLELEWKVLSTIRSMPAINLDRVNKGGMAWTKEFRVPFLDRALVLYLMGCKKSLRKGIFKDLARRVGLPSYILEKPKYGTEEKQLEKLGV